MTPDLPVCPCGHVMAIHGTRGCVAASGCGCRRPNFLSLPLLSTTTGGRPPERYCSACLSRNSWGVPEVQRTAMHPACREVLDAIRTAPKEAAA